MMKKMNQGKNNQIVFSQWTRTAYGVFTSMRKVVIIGVLSFAYSLLALPIATFAQSDTTTTVKNVDLDEIVVSGQRSPAVYSQLARVVEVFTEIEIQQQPSASLHQLLDNAAATDIRQRGAFDIQGDLSIRGGSFDQSLVLLNGINLSDPQTGHFNLNLPINLENIDRIEILEGPGARIFGANAFSGAVNLITSPQKTKSLSVNLSAGAHELFRGNVVVNWYSGNFSNQLVYSQKSTSGYTENTDFETQNLFYQARLDSKIGLFDFSIGYLDKSYGANSFYTPKYPNQFEENEAYLSTLKYSFGQKIKYNISGYLREHHDHFVLFRDNPEAYENFHRTMVMGSDFSMSIPSRFGKTSLGVNIRQEAIMSNNLGIEVDKVLIFNSPNTLIYGDERLNTAFFAEHNLILDKLNISAGFLVNSNSVQNKIGFFPGIDLSYKILQKTRLYASFNKSLRLPTFTDMYYQGPSNIGNPDLKPEEALSFEGGLKFGENEISAHALVFRRYGKNIIDWIWSEQEIWCTKNLVQLTTTGFETAVNFDFKKLVSQSFFVEKIRLSYSYTQIDKTENEFISHYALDNLKHKFTASINHSIVRNLTASWQLNYQDRNGNYLKYNPEDGASTETPYEAFICFDGKLNYSLKSFDFYIELNNILDTRYFDLGNVPQPGRWSRVGVRLNLDFEKM